MDEALDRMNALRDERLPLLPALLGEDARELLAAAAGIAGGELRDFQVSNVTWQPGASLTVRYEASVGGRGGDSAETFVAVTGSSMPSGALEFERDGAQVALWRLPNDVALPGLAPALAPVGARALLDSVGAPAGEVTPRLRAYRPGRRAVVHLQGDGIEAYVKVVRPERVAALQEAHRAAAEALPVPRSFGWSAEHGVVLLQALPGMTFRDALGRQAPLPEPAAVAGLLDRIPTTRGATRAADPVDSARAHGVLLRRLLPDQGWRLDRLLAGMSPLAAGDRLVPVHGDLYEAQLLTDGHGGLTGMIDIDTIGLGHRVDDWANFVGHLATWEGLAPRPAAVREYAKRLLAHADRECDPVALRERVAAVIVGLATGPFRVQQGDWPAETRRRIALAGEWVASAERVGRQRGRVLAAGR